MYEFFQKLHSGWAYVVLILLLVTVVKAIISLKSKKDFMPADRKMGLFALIATHLQLVIGIVIYFVSPFGKASLGQMSDSTLRLTSMEHPLINIIAIVLITIGWSKHKKATTNKAKFKCFVFYYGLGLLFIISRIPWKLWM